MIDEAPSLTAACERLIKTANERGGEDNVTVILARLDEAAPDYSFEDTITIEMPLPVIAV